MSKFRLERTLPYAADKLWDMVGDVERYPEFIPWITRLNAYNRKAGEDGRSGFDADVAVGFKMLTETFSTRVTRDAGAKTVDMNLIKGPFRTLDGRWTFTPTDTGTKVAFDMDVVIRNPILDALFKANVDRAIGILMRIFEQRANDLYSNAK